MAAHIDFVSVAISAGMMAAGIAYAWSARRVRDWMVRMMQKNGYVRSLQITGGLIALMGFLGLAVQVWTMVRGDRPSNHRAAEDRSDRTDRNNDARLEGAAPASDSN